MQQLNRWAHGALLVGALLALAALGACSGGDSPTPSPAPGDRPTTPTQAATAANDPVPTLRISQGSDLLSMDPYVKLESPSFSIQRNVYNSLTDYDNDFKVVPLLATSWEKLDDTHWRFLLREGVKFHNGSPFTADDVVYSVRRALDWPLSRVSSEIPTIKAITAENPHAVLIETSLPDAVLPRRLASILILDRETVEPAIQQNGDAWLATRGIGTGPYKVESWSKDNPCILVANEEYWDGAPNVKRLHFDPTPVDTTRMAALQRGDIDVLLNVPPRYVAQAEKIPGYRVIRRPGLRLIYLGLDTGRDKSPGVASSPPNPLKDLRVRQALQLAIDNRLIVRTIMGGNAEPADQLLPPKVIGHVEGFTLERPNLEKARALLAEAGYPNGFAVRLDGPNDRYVNDAQVMQAVAQQLAKLGVSVEVAARPKAQFFADEEKGNCSFFLIGWSNTNGDGIGTFDHLLHTADRERKLGVANSSTSYSNPQVDALCEQASAEFDEAKRDALIQQAHRLAMQDVVHIPLHFQMDIYAVSEKVEWDPRPDMHVRGQEFKWK